MKEKEKNNICEFQRFPREKRGSKSSLVWRLLRKNVSVAQIVGYAVANLVGLAIVLTAIQFYNDVSGVWEEDDSFFSKDYLIISKRVSGLNSFFGSTAFTDKDIEDIESQPWTRKVGRFTAATFDVRASVDLGGKGMSSALFLEAIPDEFFDVKPRGWGFEPGQKQVPIILSKDYLALYNFGFAATRGLPQLSESTIGKVPLKLYLSGDNGNVTEVCDARIVGFSSRMNTIAVPQDFLEWANDRYASSEDKSPSRLIIEVNSPGNPDITKYLEANNYEVAGDKVDNGKASYFLSIITGVVVSVGIIISILAFFILMLSIYLLLQKNKEKLHDLMLLGYTPSQVARQYYLLVGAVNGVVLCMALIIVALSSMMWSAPLADLGVDSGSMFPSVIVGVVVMTLITIGNFIAISRKVERNFYDS